MKIKMKPFGVIFYYLAAGISFFGSFIAIVLKSGFMGGLVAFLLFPETVLFGPLYVGFSTGNWTLCALAYGAGLIATLLVVLAKD